MTMELYTHRVKSVKIVDGHIRKATYIEIESDEGLLNIILFSFTDDPVVITDERAEK